MVSIKDIKIFSAFSGIGCAELALKELGFNVINVGTSEVDKNAIIAYDAIHNEKEEDYPKLKKEDMISYFKEINIGYNFSTNKSEVPRSEKDINTLYFASKRNNNYGDIRGIDATKIPDFDMFTYGFPCKNVSIIGNQDGLKKGSDTQSSLLWECKKIISAKKPKYLQMENVKNLVSKKHISELEEWIKELEELGYKSKYKVLNACNFGVPQNRERVIMISVLNEEVKDFNIGYPTTVSVEDIMEINQDLRLLYSEDEYIIYDKSIEKFKLNHIGMLKGKPHANKRIYHTLGYSPTLNSMNGGNRQPKFYNGKYVRKASSKECWRLMGIKDIHFLKARDSGIANSKLYERAGRGIVVPMLTSVFSDIL